MNLTARRLATHASESPPDRGRDPQIIFRGINRRPGIVVFVKIEIPVEIADEFNSQA